MSGIASFWPNHTFEPPHFWTQWSDQFQLAIITKENLDIDSLNGPEVPETQIIILEQPTASDLDTDRASREARNKNALKLYEADKEKRVKQEKKKFKGMRRAEADKKLSSILVLALGSAAKEKKAFVQKNPRVKMLAISFT